MFAAGDEGLVMVEEEGGAADATIADERPSRCIVLFYTFSAP